MDEDPVNVIRESTRNLVKCNRRALRNEERDGHRSVVVSRVTTEQVTDIANRLKSKSQVTTEELFILKNALMNDDKKNIDIVLSTNGALRGLVREISGTDVKRQCAAAGCCCNLALGEMKSCAAVAKAAGSYLVANLDNLNAELAMTCAWALGNMAGSGAKACDCLIAQGALTKLTDMLYAHDDIRDAGLYALTHFAYQLRDALRAEHLEKILNALFTLETSVATSHLLFILSCHDYFENATLPEPFLQKLLKITIVSTKNYIPTYPTECCQLTYILRTLANVATEENCLVIINCFLVENISDYFGRIFQSDNNVLIQSLLWLLGVLYDNCNDNEFFKMLH